LGSPIFADRKKTETLQSLATMNGAMHEGFDDVCHHDRSCRDLALLLIEAARCLRLGARCVSDYL
jgi:hypothetical protein